MKKTLLFILTVLVMAPMLSGCFYYPYRDGWYGRDYRDGRGYRDDRGYYDRRGNDDSRGGYRDYDDRR